MPSRVDPDRDARAPVWTRLHALAGVLPLAGYFVLHLATQASVFAGVEGYERLTRAIDGVPGLLGLEILFIYLPLAFNVLAGFGRVWLQPRSSGGGWPGRFGRELRVASGAVLLAFLTFHFWQFRWRLWAGELSRSDFYPELCASLSSTIWGGVPAMALAYLLAIAAGAFHTAYGLYHHATVHWDLRSGRERLLVRCCAAVGVGLFLLGALIVIDLATGSVLIHFPG